MTFKLGLTGSIGMGKSTTAQMFKDVGCAVWDADAAVHRLYARGGAAVQPLRALYPEVISDGAVSRDALRTRISETPDALKQIEAIVHPLVAKDRKDFLASTSADIAVLDIPLLFETGSQGSMDAVACVSVPANVQKQRVLDRGTMSESQFEQILENQMPNDEKCARADYVIETHNLEQTRAQVQTIVTDIKKGMDDA